MNYYNESDPRLCLWLAELIKRGLIPDGRIDCRDIRMVAPGDVAGFSQCHFFAGVGGWARALDLAGWGGDRPIWTGSPPCQPFSSAGKGGGESDERHLWPEFFRLIAACRPAVVVGEQVANAVAHGWLDGVCRDLGSAGYSCGAVVLGAESVGAPHLRRRLYWGGRLGHPDIGEADSAEQGQQMPREGLPRGRVADTRLLRQTERGVDSVGNEQRGEAVGWGRFFPVLCSDGRYRRVPVESVLHRMVDGVPVLMARGGAESGFPLCRKGEVANANAMLKAMGNAIVPPLAAEFMRDVMMDDGSFQHA